MGGGAGRDSDGGKAELRKLNSVDMVHLLVKVVEFSIVAPYTLRIIFDDGTEQTIDFAPVLHGYYFGP